MLKITTRVEADRTTLALEGRFAGPWVKELEECWRSLSRPGKTIPVRVDLTSVTFIDEEGKSLLGRMHRAGAELVASGCLNRCIVEGITRSEEGSS
jgi:hypothetical protein